MKSNMSINLSIKNGNKDLSQQLVKHLALEIRDYFENVFNKIKSKLSSIIIEAIKNSPEYQSLLNGKLKAEFGLPDSDNRINSILNFWENTSFEFSNVMATGNKLKGKFSLNMIQSDFADVLSLSESIFTTEKGTDLNWLEWLLLFGDKVIIKDYEVELGSNPRSRTGLAVMKKTLRGKWRVPPEYSGTINNNWITRSIDSVSSEIENLINRSLS